MEEREQQAHRERLDLLRGKRAHGLAQRRLVQRTQHLAAEIDALPDFAGQARRDEQRRLVVHHVEDRRAVRAGLLADRINAAKAFSHQQAGPHAFAFEQRIGSDRGAVAEKRDLIRLHALAEQRLDALQDRA